MNKNGKILLPIIILLMAIIISVVLIRSKPQAGRRPVKEKTMIVKVLTATPTSERITVTALGTVQPAREVVVSPEVGGLIIEQSPKLLPGGWFQKGETILKIDPHDYFLALEQSKANLESARFDLKVEQGRGKIAAREWDLLGDDIKGNNSDSDLALRKSHLVKTEALLVAAKSRYDQARLNIERTRIQAPFNALVRAEFVDVGQLVSPQTKLATLVGTDRFLVQVSVPVNHLQWLKIPGASGDSGSRAVVSHRLGQGREIIREGEVAQLLGDLDPVGRMARLLVSVDNPFDQQLDDGIKNIPLLIGAYVSVEIEGAMIEDVIKVPRTALRDDGRVYVMDDEDRLAIRDVDITWRRDDFVLVASGIIEGDRIILSRIKTPIPGMKLRVQDQSRLMPKRDNGAGDE